MNVSMRGCWRPLVMLPALSAQVVQCEPQPFPGNPWGCSHICHVWTADLWIDSGLQITPRPLGYHCPANTPAVKDGYYMK